MTDRGAPRSPLNGALLNDKNARTCKKRGTLHPGKKPPAGWANI